MAGAKAARGSRSQYTVAGYAAAIRNGESEDTAGRMMHIAKEPAGSPQEALRDLNRIGYRSERPWRETPTPLFQEEWKVEHRRAAVRPAQPRRLTLAEKIIVQAKKEKKDAVACAVLFVLILLLLIAWGQKIVKGVELQRSIANYEAQTVALQKENERLGQRLEQAKSGERIRNLAQNELNMLRPERAQTEMITIQSPGNTAKEAVQQDEEPKMEALDFLLGLLNVFHIGE